ncbi:hypothetical protein J3T65_03960 [Staphylococcus simiae]|uniref:hypothetical protein n=1 Tax=Staphylococcus simiae TaxID=308354 RepID=UPI001A95B530|nr:hypothetical protein [Staphylococcus simiae]MBO1198638.1 hypothetical protein [Staphylococcus simiae]MBO1200877.1 hypothetical protein [Staphylococcus simiae]MBO1203085.1 hypothetical protein [Staphylococcus simiae]MBO1211756.1 hypothetical protein [Staphylococcus simiae]MBO1229213.1 hypothetical protein [Staphylococcus simiae]
MFKRLAITFKLLTFVVVAIVLSTALLFDKMDDTSLLILCSGIFLSCMLLGNMFAVAHNIQQQRIWLTPLGDYTMAMIATVIAFLPFLIIGVVPTVSSNQWQLLIIFLIWVPIIIANIILRKLGIDYIINAPDRDKRVKVMSAERTKKLKYWSLIITLVSVMLILIALYFKLWLLLIIPIMGLIIIVVIMLYIDVKYDINNND